MSGGHFDYNQYRIGYIADEIEELIASNNDESLDNWGYPIGRKYSAETIAEFEKAVKCFRLAFIYAHRIDWLVSDDGGEESFHTRLKEELRDLELNDE